MRSKPKAPVQLMRIVGSQRHRDCPQIGVRHDRLDKRYTVAFTTEWLQNKNVLEMRKRRAVRYDAPKCYLCIADKTSEA